MHPYDDEQRTAAMMMSALRWMSSDDRKRKVWMG